MRRKHQSDQRPLILHVIHHLYIGGMENGLVNIINTMPADKFRHAIMCVEDYSDFRDRIQRNDVEVIAVHREQVGLKGLRKAVYNYCKQHRPAIVHSRGMSGLDALLPARLAGVRHRIHGEHGRDMDDLDGKKNKPVIQRMLYSTMVSHYITVSKDLETYLRRRVRIRARRITQVYNGVDVEKFAPVTKTRDALPASLREQSPVIFATVGRLQPVKNQALLLRAYRQMLNQHPQLSSTTKLAIVGDGPKADELTALVAELNLAENVWLTGARNDVADLLPQFDVFVLPSLAEGISNTVLEAMACGLPVIASAVGGNVELVEDGKTGSLFASENGQELAEIMAGYVLDHNLRQQRAAAARSAAMEKFSLNTMVARYQHVYADILQRQELAPDSQAKTKRAS